MAGPRCGYTLPDYALPPGVGGHCCWRPEWDGSERRSGSRRCRWHARVDGKRAATVESAWNADAAGTDDARRHQPAPLDHARLDGATVPESVSFDRTSLSGVQLSGATASRVRFREAVLVNARLVDATLEGSDLGGADLSGADLSGAVLADATLSGADLSGADLTDADLSGADLSDARLEAADLAGAMATGADLSGANLVEADLAGTDLRRASLDDASAADASFEDATLRGVRLAGAVLDGAAFTGADLSEADLEGAGLHDADLHDADLVSANLTGADLQWADLSGTNLVRASLDDAILWRTAFTGASLARATMTNARTREGYRTTSTRITIHPSGVSPTGTRYERTVVGTPRGGPADSGPRPIEIVGYGEPTAALFAGADLSGADLSSAELYAPDFEGAVLEDATLADATLRGGSLRRASLERANLTRTDLFDADLTGAEIYAATVVETQINAGTAFGAHYDDGESLAKAAWTHRTLERLFRSHALPTPARRHYVHQKDVLRRQYRNCGAWGKYLRAVVSSAFTRYGESPLRVVLTSVGVILCCALFYPVLGGIRTVPVDDGSTRAFGSLPLPIDPVSGPALVLFESLYYSAATFATLGTGELRPASQAVQVLSLMEAFTGALLMALFVYVLGRRATW